MNFKELNKQIKGETESNLTQEKIDSSLTQEFKDVERITQNFHEMVDCDPLVEKAKSYQITNEDTAKQALSMTLQARKLRKALDESRKEVLRPHIDFQRSINKIAKDVEKKLVEIETNLSVKMNNWLSARSEVDPEDYSPIAIENMQVEDGTMTVQKSWDFIVYNFNAIPHEYLMVDEKKVKEAIKAGIRNIRGITIKQCDKISMRVKN